MVLVEILLCILVYIYIYVNTKVYKLCAFEVSLSTHGHRSVGNDDQINVVLRRQFSDELFNGGRLQCRREQ